MDLLQSVRKEGSRGGVNFKWEDVKNDSQRENYLGHSLMAPVGRWQKGKDLNWYAKADDADKTPEERAAAEQERKIEELRKVKEAEEDAMAKALGLPPPDRSANTLPLGKINRALKEALDDGSEGEEDSKAGVKEEGDGGRDRDSRRKDGKRRDRSRDRRRHHQREDEESAGKRRRRSQSRSRGHERERRYGHRHRSRSRPREYRRRRSRSRDGVRDEDRPRRRRDYDEGRPRSRDREQRYRRRSRSRSRSPYRRAERRHESYDR